MEREELVALMKQKTNTAGKTELGTTRVEQIEQKTPKAERVEQETTMLE